MNAINLVTAAIQKKRVAEEGETVVKTKAFYMNLKRSRKTAFNTSVYNVTEASDVRVSLPSPNLVLKDVRDDDTIDVQVNISNIGFLHPSIIDTRWKQWLRSGVVVLHTRQTYGTR